MKTGGLVVWRRKDILVIYRGCNYQPNLGPFPKMNAGRPGPQDTSFSNLVQRDFGKRVGVSEVKSYGDSIDGKISKKNAEGETIPAATIYRTDADFQSNSSLYEREADRLLDGLGPRFIDWWMNKPLPVDADLLPLVIPGFRPPYRRCPPHTRSKLADDELTYLRKLARTLPTHFVLGIISATVTSQFCFPPQDVIFNKCQDIDALYVSHTLSNFDNKKRETRVFNLFK